VLALLGIPSTIGDLIKMYPNQQQSGNGYSSDQTYYAPTATPTTPYPNPQSIATPTTPFIIPTKNFNRDYFDFRDPLENAGYLLANNNFSDSYPIGDKPMWEIINKLYGSVFQKIRADAMLSSETIVEDVAFRDVRAIREDPRRYLVIRRETNRDTHIAAYATFLPFGDHLYFSVRVILLGPTNWWKVIVSFIPFLMFFPSFLALGSITILPLALLLFFYAILYRTIIASLRHGDPFPLALRKRFNKRDKLSTFNSDDIFMFYKSTVPMILRTIQEVFEEYGIPVTVIQDYLKMVSISTNINVERGGAFNTIGNFVAGIDNNSKTTITGTSNNYN
jgi:hypothetical protein